MFSKTQRKLKKIWEVIEYEFFNCDWDEVENFLIKENTDESKIAYAYFNEKRGRFEDALKISHDYGNSNNYNSILSKQAVDRTRIIFNNSQDKRFFHDYIQWVLIKYPKVAFDLFLTSNIVPPEYFFRQ
jgi:hypothetical protein